jgi:hypothetical protein
MTGALVEKILFDSSGKRARGVVFAKDGQFFFCLFLEDFFIVALS